VARFTCKKHVKSKHIALKKGDNCCNKKMHCPFLYVRRPYFDRGVLKFTDVRVVSEFMSEIPDNIKCD